MPGPRHIFGQDEQFRRNPNIIQNLNGYRHAGNQILNTIVNYIAPRDHRTQQILRRNIIGGLAANGLSIASTTYQVIAQTLPWINNAITKLADQAKEAQKTGTFINLL